jgi:hypothetical protein
MVGNGPAGIAFDGCNIWVTNWWSDDVTVLNASDGTPVSFSPVHLSEQGPCGIVFDGANVDIV